jgi:membrane-associated PAP2 superfamily phosphatase
MNASKRFPKGFLGKLILAFTVFLTFPEWTSAFQTTELGRACLDNQQLMPVGVKQSAPAKSSGGADLSSEAPSWHAMITNLPTDWYRAFDLSFRTENLPEFVGLTALTGALIAVDMKTWTATRNAYEASHFVREVSDNVSLVGDNRYQLGFVGALVGYGLVAGNKRALRVASQSVEAVLATGVAVQFLKRVTGRESPITATRSRGRWKFFPLPKDYNRNEPRYYSFPSGHISSTMAAITVISNNYPDEKWVKPVGYSVVALLSASLVAKGMHWYSDLPLGIAMGYMFGNVVSEPEALKSTIAKKETPLTLSIGPVLTDTGVALRLGVLF